MSLPSGVRPSSKDRSARSGRTSRPRETTPNSFRIVTWEPVDLSRALVVVGFPSVGLVGSIATAHLVKALKLREIGTVLSLDFPPTAVLEDGLSVSPIRVYLGDVVCGPDGACDQLCVIHSDIAPKPRAIPSLTYAFVTWAREHRAAQLVCLEGTRTEASPSDEARVLGVASDAAGRRMLDRMGLQSPEDGPLVGVGGVALYQARALGQPAVCVLAETREEYPDARGAAKLLEVLNALVPRVKIDGRPLLEQAQVLESVFRQRREQSSQAVENLSRPSDIMFG